MDNDISVQRYVGVLGQINTQNSMLSWCMKHVLVFCDMFIKFCWMIIAIIFFTIEFVRYASVNYFILFIMIFSFLYIIRKIIELIIAYNKDRDIEVPNSYYILTTILGILYIFYYISFIIIFFIFASYRPQISYIFMLIYVSIEYGGILAIIVLMLIILKCGIMICCPQLLIHFAHALPIQNELTEEQINKLHHCIYSNSTLISENSNELLTKYHDEFSCTICHEPYQNGDPIILLECGHHYHKQCCLDWLKINRTCPLCRSEINI